MKISSLKFFGLWVLATAAGWGLVGYMVFALQMPRLDPTETPTGYVPNIWLGVAMFLGFAFINGLVLGGAVGGLQALVLHFTQQDLKGWGWATLLGYAFGSPLALLATVGLALVGQPNLANPRGGLFAMPWPLVMLFTGLWVALAQWRVLRPQAHGRPRLGALWVAGTTLAWGLSFWLGAYLLFYRAAPLWVPTLAVGALIGVITGGLLMLFFEWAPHAQGAKASPLAFYPEFLRRNGNRLTKGLLVSAALAGGAWAWPTYQAYLAGPPDLYHFVYTPVVVPAWGQLRVLYFGPDPTTEPRLADLAVVLQTVGAQRVTSMAEARLYSAAAGTLHFVIIADTALPQVDAAWAQAQYANGATFLGFNVHPAALGQLINSPMLAQSDPALGDETQPLPTPGFSFAEHYLKGDSVEIAYLRAAGSGYPPSADLQEKLGTTVSEAENGYYWPWEYGAIELLDYLRQDLCERGPLCMGK